MQIRVVDPDARYFNPLRDERRVADEPVGNVSAILAVALAIDRARRVLIVGTTG